jgi:hypothetical protein
VGDLHNKNCFTCKKPGPLLECHNCPRSYHQRCLDPPIHGNFKIDGPWFCPNCTLLKGEEEEGTTVNGMMNNHSARLGDAGSSRPMRVELDVNSVTPLPREKEWERVGCGLVQRGGRKESRSPALGGVSIEEKRL